MTANTDNNEPKQVNVLVIAHPDDESMFFVPTIHHLVQQQQRQRQQSQQQQDRVWIVCLTSGNYGGLGRIRSKELHQTCRNVLGIEKVILVEEESVLIDHPQKSWDINQTTDILLKTLIGAIENEPKERWGDNLCVVDLITFDERGVSGHVNHRDTYRTVRRLCEQVRDYQHQQGVQTKHQSSSTSASQLKALAKLSVRAWTLETETNLIAKYLPIYSWILFAISLPLPILRQQTHEETPEGKRLYRLHQPSLNWNAMRSHTSQFVWYRRLFVIFSCYTYVNVLRRIDDCGEGGHSHERAKEQKAANKKKD